MLNIGKEYPIHKHTPRPRNRVLRVSALPLVDRPWDYRVSLLAYR